MYDTQCDASAEVLPVIGFAADGFPIHCACFNDNGKVCKAKSSYALKSGERRKVEGFETPSAEYIASSEYDGRFVGDFEFKSGQGDLDQCNSMTVNGHYETDSYPWVLACFSETPDDSFLKPKPKKK